MSRISAKLILCGQSGMIHDSADGTEWKAPRGLRHDSAWLRFRAVSTLALAEQSNSVQVEN
jgi:hypothetical protein